MASPELTKSLDPTGSSIATAAAATKTDSNAADSNATHAQSGKEVQLTSSESAPEPYLDFNRAADDAMWLLMYASETGKTVDDKTRSSILRARALPSAGWDDTIAANLLVALTKLASDLNPVTADSLRASRSNLTKPTIKILRGWTAVLAVPIVLVSLLSFVSSSISSAVRTDITTANDLLVKLRSELGTQEAPTAGTPAQPALPSGLNEGDVITQLQQYASTIRAIDARSRQLNAFVLGAERDPFANLRWDPKLGEKGYAGLSPDVQQSLSKKDYDSLTNEQKNALIEKQNEDNQKALKAKFQLTVGLPNMPADLDTLTGTYQDVRSFAQDILDRVSVYYGAITTCLLPVLYALLGTCAYLLRSFEEEVRTLTFTPSSRANWARFLIAGIGGAVVGLFSNFTITQGASISPLAIAFLVGYAVDVFFSFLEGLLQAFTKRKGSASSQAA